MKRNILLFFFVVLYISCSDEITDPPIFEPLEVDIRMEIQILDTTYQLYSRPFTKIYFTTYKLTNAGIKENFSQSDTTSCPNGWGVILLNFKFNNTDEIFYLGAACEDYIGPNYREIKIDFEEAQRRIDSTGHASIIKTFAIYYN